MPYSCQIQIEDFFQNIVLFSQYTHFKKTANEEYETFSSTTLSVLDLFKTPVLRTNIILMIINWSLTSFLYEANYRNIANLPYSIYWTFTIYRYTLQIVDSLTFFHGPLTIWSSTSQLCLFQGRKSRLDG